MARTDMGIAETRHDHFFSSHPKRILALDGGGIRGIVSLAFLERIEFLLRERSNAKEFCLADYFDLIGGASTGSIIAAGLALGHSVKELIDLYLTISHETFVSRVWSGFHWVGGTFVPKFNDKALREAVLHRFGPDTLGSDRIRCGLAVVTKRLDTGSVWLFHNHPKGAFFSGDAAGSYTPNRDIPIANLLRASAAAPGYFGPEMIEIAPGVEGLFVDGSVSPHGNPSLLLMMLATQQGYGFHWPLGEDRMAIVSVGTGAPRPRPMWGDSYAGKPAMVFAAESLMSMMHDASLLVQTIMQWISSSPAAWPINSEIGDLKSDSLIGRNLVHYLRYDAPIEHAWLQGHLGLQLTPEEVDFLRCIDHPDAAPRLLEIGRKAAEAQIRSEHFPAVFD